MPLRVIAYDGAAYRAQLLKEQSNKKTGAREAAAAQMGLRKKKRRKKKTGAPRYPVITLVLYFGYEHRWNKPESLHECLQIPPELQPYVSDYKMNLFEIAYLSEEQVNQFKSDFRIVADYFVQMRKNRNYVPSAYTIRHVYEMLELMAAVTGDTRFEQAAEGLVMEREGQTMCEVLDRIEERGMKLGMKKGQELGFLRGTIETLCSLVNDGMLSLSEGAKRANMTEEAFAIELMQQRQKKS